MTPERISILTQELIDRGELPKGPPQTAADRIRRMQRDHGIGVDSEEYSYDAFLSLRKQPPEHFGLECEGLWSLPYNPHFRRVEKSELRPGDLCMLRGRLRDKVGGARDADHFAIVYSYELVTPEVQDRLRGISGANGFESGGRVHLYEMDSSWDFGPASSHGGFSREAWFFNESTGEWGSFVWGAGDTPSFEIATEGPFHHELVGFFRPVEES